MKKLGDTRLMIKCCSMYYEDNLNQREISYQLGISRPTVSRILKEAYNLGVVKIEITDVLKNDYQKIERRLEKIYGLKEAIIVDDKSDSLTQKQELAKVVSEYLSRIINENDIIGVAMGTTLKEIPNYIEKSNYNNVTFVPLIGAVGQNDIEIHANHIVARLAKEYGGKYKLLHIPAVINDTSTKENLSKDNKIQEVLNLIQNINIAIVGIGNPMSLNSAIVESEYMDDNDLESLKKNNLIGAICLQAFDKDGRSSIFEFNKKVVGVELDNLRKIDRSIGVASGNEKIEAIKASLKASFINTLATNYSTALKLIEE